ncbi:MAG: extracellular solute-binding protein [Blastochloris sp.]|nr:extracellular solute-binding protein [Blastochloris sp.]
MSNQQCAARRRFFKQLLLGGLATTPVLLTACSGQIVVPESVTSLPTAPAMDTPIVISASPTPVPASPVPATAIPTAAPTAPATTMSGRIEITHGDWWVSQGPAIDEIIERFEDANPTITVKKTTIPGADVYVEQLQKGMENNDTPDVSLLPFQISLEEQVASGWWVDLSRFDDFTAFKQTFPNPELYFLEGATTFDGRAYSAPFGAADDAMWLQFWINTKVFKDAGIVDDQGQARLPATAADVLDAARTIKATSEGACTAMGFQNRWFSGYSGWGN